jgi:rRNA maturation endonuclease Nob1
MAHILSGPFHCEGCGKRYNVVPLDAPDGSARHCPYCGSESVKVEKASDTTKRTEAQREAVDDAARKGFSS